MVHIIGSGDAPAQDEKETPETESRRVYVTNFFSLGHLVPWGGLVDVKRLEPSEIKTHFDGKRIDLFAYPDVELMGEILQQQIMTSGQAPGGTQEEHEAAFCHMVNVLVEQTTGCHVRVAQKPRPVSKGHKQVFVQLYLPPSTVVGASGIGAVWWEITPKEIRSKPEAKA